MKTFSGLDFCVLDQVEVCYIDLLAISFEACVLHLAVLFVSAALSVHDQEGDSLFVKRRLIVQIFQFLADERAEASLARPILNVDDLLALLDGAALLH